ncbi:MAG TPA: site-specific DNA-methyltransferase [Solirubrobacteraceae bacterium]|jgi:adenine-specific DNA-methyltransferase|nr:site-specific DNA-methyltransferase [Solirubrobacteraceae bacterium]
MATTRRKAGASKNGKVTLDPVTRSPGRPAGPGMYLHWEGRKGYRTRMPAPRVLDPVPELSYGDANGNRVIEGDNLQVMVSLRSHYQGMVDVAYLDPPYNTGKRDFAYSDARFHDPNADADDMVYVNNEDGGRHTKWLNYMGPRLWLTWQLLAEHGICFVSINDVELFRLGMLMDEIFGEQNRVGTIVWKQAVSNNPTRIAVEHEYILCYAKRIEDVSDQWSGVSPAKEWMLATYETLRGEEKDLKKLEKAFRAAINAHKAERRKAVAEGRGDDVIDLGRMDRYRNIDGRGPWAKDWHLEKPYEGGYFYDIPHPVTGKPVKKPPRGYRYPPESMKQLLANDLIVFGKNETEPAQLRRYLKDAATALRSVVVIPGRNGSDLLNSLIKNAADRYPHPKPVELMTLLLGAAADIDALVLDPFAGSGTTGQAVMRLNARDGGARRFILIEEGEPKDRYARTLLARRLKAAIKKEHLPGGFLFETTGRRLNRGAILELEREAIANLIAATDATGKGRGIMRDAGKYVIGHNGRQEAICLCWEGRTKSAITRDVLVAMFDEAKEHGLRRPLRVYAATCEVGETDSFRFCQIPDEILAALQIAEDDGALAGDPNAMETLETALLNAADDGG